MQIGIFCGTFNPIHWGHLLIAESARVQFAMDKIVFITSARPPHRKDDILDASHRHEMVQAAIKDNSFFEASSMEIDRQGPSYTVDTIKQLHQEYGDKYAINLIIGEDNLKFLPEWHRAEELAKLCRILVAPRDWSKAKEEINILAGSWQNGRIEIIESPKIDITASSIRRRIRENKSVMYMVPPEVNKILTAKKYYL